MQKKKLIWLIVTVAFAAICAIFMAVSSLDEIISTEVVAYGETPTSCNYEITHTFKNGKTADVKISISESEIGDGVYHILLSAKKDTSESDGKKMSSASYNLQNISAELHIKSDSEGQVYQPGSYCRDLQQSRSNSPTALWNCEHTDDGYNVTSWVRGDDMYCSYIVQGDFELSDIDIFYNLTGKGMRLGSRFEDQKTTIQIGKKVPPYADETEQ